MQSFARGDARSTRRSPDLAKDLATGFIAKGAGIRAGAVAPLVAELLGLEVEAPDGVVYPGLLAD